MTSGRLKRLCEIGLFVLCISFFLAALPALGFDKMFTGFVLLGGFFLLAFIMIWTNIPKEIFVTYGLKHKVVTTVVLVAVTGTAGFGGYYNLRNDERRDVKEGLVFTAKLPSPDNLRTSVITVTNHGHTAIQYRLVCHIKMLVLNHGTSVVNESFFANHERAGVLESGQDAQADDCLRDVSAPIQILDCADIKVRLFYTLKNQPNVQEEKDHGFITQNRGDRFEWEDRAAEQAVSDCARFVTLKGPSTRDEPEQGPAERIKSRDEELLQSHGLSSAKELAARLSLDILQFGVDEEPKTPKPNIEKDEMLGIMKGQKQFLEWGQDSSKRFHALFDSGLNRTFTSARKAGLKTEREQINCTIISASNPPTLSQTRRCGIVIGQIADALPVR